MHGFVSSPLYPTTCSNSSVLRLQGTLLLRFLLEQEVPIDPSTCALCSSVHRKTDRLVNPNCTLISEFIPSLPPSFPASLLPPSLPPYSSSPLLVCSLKAAGVGDNEANITSCDRRVHSGETGALPSESPPPSSCDLARAVFPP